MSAHTEQIASVLRRTVQEILTRRLNDPRVRGLISVTRVSVSDDLANATVYVSILPEKNEKLTMQGLRSATGHIRGQVSRAVKLRRMPRLSFELDETLKREAAVLAAINRAVGEREEERENDVKR